MVKGAVRFLPSKYRRDPVSAVQTGDLPLSSIVKESRHHGRSMTIYYANSGPTTAG